MSDEIGNGNGKKVKINWISLVTALSSFIVTLIKIFKGEKSD